MEMWNNLTNVCFRGTVISIYNKVDKLHEDFLLVENYENDFIFQVVCITGYNKGRIFGYVAVDSLLENDNIKGVSHDFLVNELKGNLADDIYDYNTFSID